MINEDAVAAKLKGHNCLIKFMDGEELTIYVKDIDSGDADLEHQWFVDVEGFLNGIDDDNKYFPLANFSVSQSSIKYVKKI